MEFFENFAKSIIDLFFDNNGNFNWFVYGLFVLFGLFLLVILLDMQRQIRYERKSKK